MKTLRGAITIGTLLAVVSGTAASIVWVVTYVNVSLAPVMAQSQENQTALSALTTKMEDTNLKVNALYEHFLNKGLNTPIIK